MAIRGIKSLGEISEKLFNYIEPDKRFTINDISIEPFSISHDVANPVCYTWRQAMRSWYSN